MRRSLLVSSAVGGSLACLYSCSMQASVSTDAQGHVVSVSTVRVSSNMPRLAVGLLIATEGLSLELRWRGNEM